MNIFQTYYVAGYQPLLAEQAQADRGWLLQVDALVQQVLTALEGHPQAAASWHKQVLGDQPHQEFGRWKAAVSAHTQAWQWQLRTCGFLLGR